MSLGIMYRNGDGVPKDLVKSARYLEVAAEKGNAKAQLNLGGMYYTGEGVHKDVNKAVKWWGKSAAQGNPGAQANLDKLI